MAEAIQIEGKDEASEYYDILLLGRTGFGKSTTANKLLRSELASVGADEHVKLQWEEAEDGQGVGGGGTVAEGSGGKKGAVAGGGGAVEEASKEVFETGGGIESVTNKCKLVSNENTNIRVLDTPGFADTRDAPKRGVFRGNLKIFRSILRAQQEKNLAFSRVLYFLPMRGPPERADGTVQEEIKLIEGFLGEEVFKIMVIIATNRYRRSRPETVFYEEDIEITRRVFMAALEKITDTAGEGKQKIIDECPPIVYLPYLETEVIAKIVSAPVLSEQPLKKPVVVEISKSTPSTEELIQNTRRQNKGRKLQLQERCIKCSAKLIYSDTARRRLPSRVVINEGGEEEEMLPYSHSKCHPLVIPRYSTIVKITGGVAHLMMLGLFVAAGKIRGKKFWPGFTNDEELCVCCNKDPSADACYAIGKVFKLKTKEGEEDINTCHSTTLDRLHIV